MNRKSREAMTESDQRADYVDGPTPKPWNMRTLILIDGGAVLFGCIALG